MRTLLLTLALLLAAEAQGQQQSRDSEQPGEAAFAGLSVLAFGDQQLDLSTGITTLPDGGQVIDRQHGVTLTAGSLRYREGEFVEAQEVELSGDFGVAHAESVYIDLTQGRLDATGGVVFERETLGLTAQSLQYYANEGVIRFEGPVSGVGLDFEGAAAVFDAAGEVFLLAAPYRYQDALFELSSDREGALLSLTPAGDESGSLVASSTVEPGLLARLAPFLPQGAPAGAATESGPL
ncbi:MAG: hypothetical protein WD273_08990 [Trueperaceae bacterium]